MDEFGIWRLVVGPSVIYILQLFMESTFVILGARRVLQVVNGKEQAVHFVYISYSSLNMTIASWKRPANDYYPNGEPRS